MSGLVLLKRPKFVIPESVIQHAAGTHTGCYGMAAAFDEDLDIERGSLPLDADNFQGTVDGIMENQKAYLDALMVFHFSTSALSNDSMQPFVIKSIKETVDGVEKESPLLVAFLSDGDYSKHAEAGSSHSPAFFAMAKFLRPKLLTLMADKAIKNEEDIRQKFDDNIQDIISGAFGPENVGAMTLVFFDGEAQTYVAQGSEGKEFDWGWQSASWQKTAAPVVTATTGNKKRRSLVQTTDPTPAPTTATPEKPVVTDANVINANFAANGSKPIIKARPKAMPNKQLRKAYEAFNVARTSSGRGVIPNAWKSRCGIEVSQESIKNQRDYFLSVMEVVPDIQTGDLKDSTAVSSGTVPSAPSTTPNVDVRVGGLPLLVGTEKDQLIEFWKTSKLVNEAANRTAADLQKLEAVHTPLDYYFPLTLADLKKHSPESLAQLNDEYPDFVLHCLWHALHPAPVTVPRSDLSPGTKTPPVVTPAPVVPPAAPKKKRSMIQAA